MLSPEGLDQFIRRGYVVVEGAFPLDIAAKGVEQGFKHLGLDPNAPSTWKPNYAYTPATRRFDAAETTPAAWQVMCELMGGADRVKPCQWGDGLIFALGDGSPWIPPSAAVTGWHKDGNFFRHYLDSPEQGMLPLVCWTNMVHQGGATFIAPDSIKVVSEHLLNHPEGVGGKGGNDPVWSELINKCHEFQEVTANAGDVVLMHPFMLHTASQNYLRVPRAISNFPVGLKEPMQFNRPSRADFSAVELSILHALGAEALDFRRQA